MALTNKLEIKIRSTLTGTVGLSDVSSVIAVSNKSNLDTVATDAIFTATGIIAGGAVVYDLAGALTDPLGDAVIFAKVMAVYIINNGTEDPMTVGAANNIPMLGSGDVMNLAVGAYFQFTDPTGITVTPATGDLITITGTNDDTFDIIIIGSST